MQRRIDRFLGVLFIALCALAFTIIPLSMRDAIQAAPSQAGPVQVFTLNSAAVATSTTWAGGRWSALGTAQPPTEAEVWLSLDMGTVNTATFALQVSPDGVTYVAHAAGALATDLAADTNQYTALTIRGVYYRVVMTATNSNTLTPTIKVVVR